MLRDATLEDAAAITAVFRAAVASTASHYAEAARAAWADGLTAARVAETISGGRERFLLAEQGGRVVGFGSLLGREISMLYVHPDASGAGVGGALLAALEARARAEGHAVLRLRASKNAQGFYARRGYRAVEEGVRRMGNGVTVAYVWMEKR